MLGRGRARWPHRADKESRMADAVGFIVYQMARAGFNKEDGTAVIKVLERLAGVRVGRGEAPTEGAR